MKIALAVITAIILCGCQSTYTATVTITEVRDSIMKELANAYQQGLITAEQDQKIEKLDHQYRLLAQQAALTLKLVRANQQSEDMYLNKLEQTRAVVRQMLDIITPMLVSTKRQNLDNKLSTASGI